MSGGRGPAGALIWSRTWPAHRLRRSLSPGVGWPKAQLPRRRGTSWIPFSLQSLRLTRRKGKTKEKVPQEAEGPNATGSFVSTDSFHLKKPVQSDHGGCQGGGS